MSKRAEPRADEVERPLGFGLLAFDLFVVLFGLAAGRRCGSRAADGGR